MGLDVGWHYRRMSCIVTTVPDPTALMSNTVELLKCGLSSSAGWREALSVRCGLTHNQDGWAGSDDRVVKTSVV
jgi:hypothetical protein